MYRARFVNRVVCSQEKLKGFPALPELATYLVTSADRLFSFSQPRRVFAYDLDNHGVCS